MANLLTIVAGKLTNANAGALGIANALNDGISLIETLQSSTASNQDKATATLQFANNFLTRLGVSNPIAALEAVQISAGLLISEANEWSGNPSSVQNFAGMIGALGNLIAAVGVPTAQPELVLAGTLLNSYGIVLETIANTSANSGIGSSIYDWIEGVTQNATRAEAMGYATSLSISLGMPGEATAKVFIDGSKSNDTGIVESVEYIKNIRKLLGLGTAFTATTANDVYEAVQETRLAIQTLFGDTKFEITGVSDARNELPAFLSLYHLVPFAIKPTDAGGMNTLYELHATIADLWNDDRNLTTEQIANGKANFSDMWLADRKAMLGWVLKSNLEETTGRADGLNVIYEDAASGVNLSPIIVSNTAKFIFGSANGDAITGGNKADHLYGMAGNDTINGGEGNDYIEGNAGQDTLKGEAGNDILIGGTDVDILDGGTGNDQLKGGDGVDVYQFTGTYGTDIITDTDGQGIITIDNNLINSGTLKLEIIYKNEALGYTITKVNGGKSLVISKKGDANRIIIKDWSEAKNLSLNLTGSMPAANNNEWRQAA